MRTKRSTQILVPITVFALIFISSMATAEEKHSEETKAAIVNGEVINKSEFDQELENVKKRFSMMGKSITDEEMKDLKKDTLDSLIGRQLLLQESKKQDIKVDQAEVDKELEKMKKRFPNEEEFNKILKKMNLSIESIAAQFKQRMTVQKLIEKEITDNIKIDDNEVKKYYDDHPAEFKRPEKIKASHILVKVEKDADKTKKEEARKRIEEIQEKLKKGESFETLAKDNSDCPSGAKGGDLGFFGHSQMVPAFEKAAFALKKGETSDIVETMFGFHIIKLVDKQAESTIPFETIKKKLSQYLKSQKTREEVEAYVEKLKKTAKIETFIKLN